jgi:hypothetical protein
LADRHVGAPDDPGDLAERDDLVAEVADLASRPLLPRERVPPMSSFYRKITGVSRLKPDWR